MDAVRACAVVPTLDNPRTVRDVVEGIARRALPVVLVDDGSGLEGRSACQELEAAGLATLRRIEPNRGKGAAVALGFRVARELGFTHGFQIDADGQHDLECIPAFLEAARARPTALVLGYPLYDETVPDTRRLARRFTSFWVALEVGSRTAIRDALIGFRVYPLAATERLARLGERMDFDVEVAVRLVRAGTPTVNLPVGVRYLPPEAGGVSHFRPLLDNLRFGRMHSRLCMEGCRAWLRRVTSGRREP